MGQLQITNTHFLTYKTDLLTVDILGGVDLSLLERMVCTLRIAYKDYPPYRTTLDLYNDNQIEKLQRTLCDKWELKLNEVANVVHPMVLELEEYRLSSFTQSGKISGSGFDPSEDDAREARKFLEDKNLIKRLTDQLNTTGIIGEDENALILFLALASHKQSSPFSALCLAKSSIGKSYLLRKLSECMPEGSYSLHTQISSNALYYFNSNDLQNKALLVEDLEWTTGMLAPLSALQSSGKLIKTRTTKDKDGKLHATTSEVNANLCLIGCAYSEKNYESVSLPFLLLHLNHSSDQDEAIMNYQRALSANRIDTTAVVRAQHLLKCVIASLKPVRVINPFAPLIELPPDLPHPRKTLSILLNFIEVVTYFHQHQRAKVACPHTGEEVIETHPDDIVLAFKLLKRSLFRRADELSASARGFYTWLIQFLQEAQSTSFTALDIRKAKSIHPRTLNRYLQELTLYCYVQVSGGNKHRGGFIYKVTSLDGSNDAWRGITQSLQATLTRVWEAESLRGQSVNSSVDKIVVPQVGNENSAPVDRPENVQTSTSAFFEKNYKRIRINEKEEYTFKLLLELEKQNPGREYLSSDITAASKRSQQIESRYLKTLWEQGRLNRRWETRQYYYSLPASKTVSQMTLSNSQTQ